MVLSGSLRDVEGRDGGRGGEERGEKGGDAQ